MELIMLIEKTKNFTKPEMFKEFSDKAKKIKLDCEVDFENVYYRNGDTFDVIRVWYPESFYGSCYIIKEKSLEIRHIDYMSNRTVDIDKKNVIDIILEEIVKCSTRSV